ncbi:MAG: ABC transporter ATP-binding protein [Clostridia bacterium]|nr:ABC transporter ATP-binding protein [Clostridia bacterium]
MEKKTVLQIKDLHVRFDTDDSRVYAVNGVNLDLREQETIGLVGETGAGKTTTVLSVLRLLASNPGAITEGEILVNGKNVLKMSDSELEAMRGNEVAMVFQDPMTSLNPVMTVGDQIAEAIEIHEKVSKAQAFKLAKKMLETVGIPGYRAGDYPHQFSGGMKQRVVIAIAIACHPKILLADEPTTALDVTIQAQVLDLMKKMAEEFKTAMILITHDLGIVAETCERVAVMYAGRIVEIGTLEDVFNRTAHPYTEGLFNSLPDLSDRSHEPKPIKGLVPDPTDSYSDRCAFANRCPYAVEQCWQKHPEEIILSDTHMVMCDRYQEKGFHIERGTEHE